MNTNENKVTFILSSINVVKKRTGGTQSCKDDFSDDERIFERGAHIFGCLPVYWEEFVSEESLLGRCNASQLQNIWKMIHKTEDPKNVEILNQVPQPCVDMSFGMSIKRGDIRKETQDRGEYYDLEMFKKEPFQIHFQYPEDNYLQTLNVQDYDFNILWANIGGYIGIILGYNIAQIPKVIDVAYKSWKRGNLIKKNIFFC